MADTLLQITRQQSIESRYNRKHIDGYIRDALTNNPNTQEKIRMGVELLKKWLSQDYYESKNLRLAQLHGLDLEHLVYELFVGIAYCLRPELFVSVTARLSAKLGFSDRRDSILTTAEMVAVLCYTDAFDITKASPRASMMLVSRLELPDELLKFIEQSEYLPPMVCEPLELTNNFSSGYLSHKDSVILSRGGNANHHNGNVCLDVLNTVNRVALSLDIDFLKSVDEECTASDPANIEKLRKAVTKEGRLRTEDEVQEILRQQQANWANFKSKSAQIYLLMYECGNEFYLTHKVDKRGRIYAQGYHINTQGSAYKKASIELAKKEMIQGVPSI